MLRTIVLTSLFACLMATKSVYGDLTFKFESKTVPVNLSGPTSGQILVSWDYTDPTPSNPPEQFRGWDAFFKVSLNGLPSVSLTGIDPPTNDVLTGDAINPSPPSPPLYDYAFTSAVGTPIALADGNLMVLDFSVPSGAIGSFDLVWAPGFLGPLTAASDGAAFVGEPYSFVNGTVTISAVPEPSELICGSILIAGAITIGLDQRNRWQRANKIKCA